MISGHPNASVQWVVGRSDIGRRQSVTWGCDVFYKGNGMNRTTDRRSFIKAVATVAAIVFTPIAQWVRPGAALAAPSTEGFRFIHDESVAMVLGFAKKDDRYNLTVNQGGREVEFFPNVDPMRLHRLRTRYFEVEYFDPLAA